MRTVDADKLLGSFIESGQKNGMKHGCKLGENWLLDYNDIKAVLDDAPTIEKRPRGKWIVYKDNYGNDKPVCSCCNKEQVGYANYCSYCGARMEW